MQQSAYLNQHAGRLTQLAMCLQLFVHQADSLTLWQCPVSLGSGQGSLRSVLWLSSCSCLAVSLSDADQAYMSALQHTESTLFACSLVQMLPFPRHHGISWHFHKFCGAACYSVAHVKPWALVITNQFIGIITSHICPRLPCCNLTVRTVLFDRAGLLLDTIFLAVVKSIVQYQFHNKIISCARTL